MLKKTGIYFLTLSTLALIIFLMTFSHAQHNKRLVKKLNLSIEDGSEHRFANEKNIRNIIYALQGPIEKKSINQMQLSLIERKLKQLDFIKEAQVYMDLDGQLNVYIRQKKPIARIKTASKNYYLTQEGALMNMCSWYSPEVLLAEGIFLETDVKMLKEMIQYINDDELLKNQIIGIRKISQKYFILLPKMGDYVIELGDLLNYKDKFEKLKAFYRQYMELLENTTYKKIRLQYAGQVVATKI
ncbi:cell division protein FtsQ/DivIB [Bacteroidetes bacterium endosymbiont of Geopemphigus sp.]|uniref:cell division protein FtsQ/DivIB n=1 Tax=Bacteroidetes bacterium endosymbiont of Geopemphigus sp. TaxID=2047937 RepID=UPI000CD28FD7|nr:cell division protein FtsQ [Bacteroidetes bacterium endosymbiont of Geopemphigus sp.]